SKVGMMTRPEESVSVWYAQRGRAQIKEKRKTVRRTANFRFILYLLLMCKMGCCSHFYLRSRPGTVEQIPLKVSDSGTLNVSQCSKKKGIFISSDMRPILRACKGIIIAVQSFRPAQTALGVQV